MKAIVSKSGQITIPKAIRQKMGVKPGTILDIDIKDAALIMLKVEPYDSVEKVYGCLKENINADKTINRLRGNK